MMRHVGIAVTILGFLLLATGVRVRELEQRVEADEKRVILLESRIKTLESAPPSVIQSSQGSNGSNVVANGPCSVSTSGDGNTTSVNCEGTK